MAKGFILGIVASIAAVIAGAYLFVKSGALPAGQDVKPGALEKWAAKTSLRATMRREAQGLKSPLPPTDENLAAGVALYVAHCQVCHGGPEGVASPTARGLTPNAPAIAWNAGANELQVVVRGEDGGIWASTFDAAGAFNNDWTKLTGGTPSPVGLVSRYLK